jgi:misacylated tRNA(Ala) deacylase
MASETVYPPLHTAEHLLTRLLCERFQALSNLQIRLKSRKAVFTFSYEGLITPADRESLELALQEIARADLPVIEGSVPRSEALARLPNMHQVPEDADPVRVIQVGVSTGTVDERACIGRHVTSTASIANPRLPTLREEEPGVWRLTLVVS